MEAITSIPRPYKALSSTLEVEHFEIQPSNPPHILQLNQKHQPTAHTRMSGITLAKECLEAWHNYKPKDGDWSLYVQGIEQPVGHIKSEIAKVIDWPTEFAKNPEEKKVSVKDQLEANNAFLKLYEDNVNKGKQYFDEEAYKKWIAKDAGERDYHPIFVPGTDVTNKETGLKVPSPIRGVLGILTAGIHVNVYTTKAGGGVDKIWVSKRSSSTYNGCFDQIIAGGMEPSHDLNPWETLTQETKEESKYKVIDGKLCSRNNEKKQVGMVCLESLIWFYTDKTDTDRTAPSELDHIEPGVRFCFDVEVSPGEIPEYNPDDNSSSGFRSLSVEDVKRELKAGNWKPNCGLVTLDFLRRKGELSEVEVRELKVLESPGFKLPVPDPFERSNVKFRESTPNNEA